VTQDTLEELGFGLDLMRLALSLESYASPVKLSLPPQVEELETTLRAVLTRADVN
jgi:hypothetical protein